MKLHETLIRSFGPGLVLTGIGLILISQVDIGSATLGEAAAVYGGTTRIADEQCGNGSNKDCGTHPGWFCSVDGEPIVATTVSCPGDSCGSFLKEDTTKDQE